MNKDFKKNQYSSNKKQYGNNKRRNNVNQEKQKHILDEEKIIIDILEDIFKSGVKEEVKKEKQKTSVEFKKLVLNLIDNNFDFEVHEQEILIHKGNKILVVKYHDESKILVKEVFLVDSAYFMNDELSFKDKDNKELLELIKLLNYF